MRIVSSPYNVDDVYEIRLLESDWEKIKQVSLESKLTYSATVRLCLFQLVQGNLPSNKEAVLLKNKIKDNYAGEQLHRHMLCLYGKDALYLKYLADQLGITVTMLVRIALHMHLDRVEAKMKDNTLDIVANGIKLFRICDIKKSYSADMEIHINRIEFKGYSPDCYWPWFAFSLPGPG